MKFIVILFAVAAVAVAEKESYKMSQEIVDKVKKFATPCADENKLDRSVILKLASGAVPDDEAGRKFIYCFTRAAGYANEDGHLVVDKLVLVMKDHPLQDKFKEGLTKCNEITKENPLATIMAMHKCFAEASPVRLLF